MRCRTGAAAKKVSTRWKFRSNRSVSGGICRNSDGCCGSGPDHGLPGNGAGGRDPCRETRGCQACRAQAHGAGRPADRGEGGCAQTEPRSSAKKETPSSLREDSGLRRANKPSVRSTGEFTFKVGESPAPSGNRCGLEGFVVGLSGPGPVVPGSSICDGIEPMSLF